jgi:hypothetical protein
MPWRICPVVGTDCACSDAEMVPCLARLIENYLDEIRDNVLGIDPDNLTLSFRRADINCICQSFSTHAALRQDWERRTGLHWPR